MTAEEAWKWLRTEGYLEPVGLPAARWHRVCKAPPRRELALFVKAVKTLGAWSAGDGARVDLSTGSEPDEVLFRLRARKPAAPPAGDP